ncbi:MAG: glycosyltransferase [Rhodospirillales bacterium]|nr:glycosyltransferase [Rhodospirillales bacterium]
MTDAPAMVASKRVVLILGMHRSGTSALTRALALAGANLPEDMLPPSADNPDGFFECRPVVLAHEDLLAELGLGWDTEPPVPATWFASPAAAGYAHRIGAVLEQELAGKTDLLLKDPRMCRLMPLWRGLCAARGIAIAAVLTVRHPLEVAASLAARNGMPTHRALLLWLRYVLEAEAGSRGVPRCVVTYDALMADGIGTLRRIGDALAIGAPGGASIQTEEVGRFLSGGRRHHRAGADELREAPKLARLIEDVYAALHHAAATGSAPDAAAFDAFTDRLEDAAMLFAACVDDWRAALAELSSVRTQALAREAALHAALEEANATIRGIRHTWSWRLTMPFRAAIYVARGRLDLATHGRVPALREVWQRIIPKQQRDWIWRWRQRQYAAWRRMTMSAANAGAIQALADARSAAALAPAPDPLRPPVPAAWPEIDLSIVTYNNGRWLEGFFASLLAQDYPLARIHLRAVDHASSDDTARVLQDFIDRLGARFASARMSHAANRGFGVGHNTAIGAQGSALVLISNVDLEFRPDTITRLVATALADSPEAALWEARQAPFEHPKLYDPVSGATNWSAFACVLLRREAFAAIGGFDPHIFLYGEDVDVSYRLRRAGHRLRYVAAATCTHHAYASAGEVKPAQYRGGLFANFYLRLRFGAARDIAAILPLSAQVLRSAPPYPGARADARRAIGQALAAAPRLLRERLGTRRAAGIHFPFHGFDYDLARPGAFVPVPAPRSLAEAPLISIVVRTYPGREKLLAQALFSLAHQSWDKLEIVVVEDGGASMAALITTLAARTGREIRHLPQAKIGRSAAGNAGLAAARGALLGFLDDDDLLFSDHLETLAAALHDAPDAAAAYALAFEVCSRVDLATGMVREEDFRLEPIYQQEFDFPTLLHHNYMPIQAVLFQRALFEQRGGFQEDMDALEDWNLWLRYAWNNRFVHVAKVTSLFRTPAEDAKREAREDIFNIAYEAAKERNDRSLAALAEATSR